MSTLVMISVLVREPVGLFNISLYVWLSMEGWLGWRTFDHYHKSIASSGLNSLNGIISEFCMSILSRRLMLRNDFLLFQWF